MRFLVAGRGIAAKSSSATRTCKGSPEVIAVLSMVGREHRLTRDMRDAAAALGLKIAELASAVPDVARWPRLFAPSACQSTLDGPVCFPSVFFRSAELSADGKVDVGIGQQGDAIILNADEQEVVHHIARVAVIGDGGFVRVLRSGHDHR